MLKYITISFIYLIFFGVILFIPISCHADYVTDCLRGHTKTVSCHRMIANYWQHNPVIEQVARQEGVEPELLKALIAYESAYNARAVSPVKASGLTQVMPGTAVGMRVNPSHLFIPEVSIRTGARYLRQMYNQFGRMDLALAAYNAGPRRVRQAGNRVPRITETQNYVRNVTALYMEFKQKGSSTSSNTASHPGANLRIAQAETLRPARGGSRTSNSAYQSHTSNAP